MTEKPLVSVIIPIYGVEKYIERCARSLFEQALDNIEFIFVNDCTKDNSIAVLEKVIEDYPNRRNQITILHHEVNKGLPQARKTGIMQAKGEYIAHCDSDDWVEKDMYWQMYEKAKNEDADIVYCDYWLDDAAKYRKHIKKFSRQTLDGEQILKGLLERDIAGNLFSYIARKLLYNNDIIYPKGNMIEDWCLSVQLLFFSEKKIAYISLPFYHYFVNPNSITRDLSEDKIFLNYIQIQLNTQIVLDFFAKHENKKYQNCYLVMKLYVKFALNQLVNKSKYYKIWKNTFSEINDYIICSPINIMLKFKYILSYLRIYPIIYTLCKFIS